MEPPSTGHALVSSLHSPLIHPGPGGHSCPASTLGSWRVFLTPVTPWAVGTVPAGPGVSLLDPSVVPDEGTRDQFLTLTLPREPPSGS